MVRDILWPDDDMHLWNFLDISQTYAFTLDSIAVNV